MKKIRSFFLGGFLFVGLVGISAFGSSSSTGKQEQPVAVGEIIVLAPQPEVENPSANVAYVGDARQICTQRMGCTCKHRRSDTDQLKIHAGGHDKHLDIKCTKCSSKWYCPEVGKYRYNDDN